MKLSHLDYQIFFVKGLNNTKPNSHDIGIDRQIFY